jgi:hypothetical protein
MTTRSECARADERVEVSGAGLPMDSLWPGTANVTANGAPIELPLSEYVNAREKLTYEEMYFPLGYPVRLRSNSPQVLEAAEQSWGCFHPVFHGDPMELLFEVSTEMVAMDALPRTPEYTFKGSLLVQMADRDNFVITDLKTGRAMSRLTQAAVRWSRYLRYHFLESAVLSMISASRAVPLHAACVRVAGSGVLLCGDSGEGKSTLAYAGSRAGWTYVSDDSTYLPVDCEDRLAIGNCHQIRFRPSGSELFPELAGRPITPRAAGKPSIEVRTSELRDISTANETLVEHVLFLNRKYADTQELIPLRTSAVWPWFKQHLISPPEIRGAQETALSRLLSAGVFELRYRDLGWAIDRINQLVKKGN